MEYGWLVLKMAYVEDVYIARVLPVHRIILIFYRNRPID